MMMNLKEQLKFDLQTAMRDNEVLKRNTLRMVLAAIQQEEVDQQKVLDEAAVNAIVSKQAKQRRESIADAEKAGRSDLIEQELAELAIIETYLPQQLNETEIRALALVVIEEVGASGATDMGQVMSQLMPKLKGRADGRMVSQVVRDLLQN